MTAQSPGTPEGNRLPDETQPFFLVGSIRAGTTMLRLMLEHHSKICRCHEMEYVASAIVGREEWPDVHSYARDLPRHYDFRNSGFVANASLTFPDLARDLFAQLRAADGKVVAGAAVHNHFDELTRIWPEARFIHLERDPRDVARSCVATGWAAGNVWAATDIWIAADDAWQRLKAQVPESRRIELKFEDVVAQPEIELERICRFLGVSYEASMLDIEHDTTYRRPSKRDARSWRDDAPPQDVRIMEARFGTRLTRAGYAPSGLPPLRISAGADDASAPRPSLGPDARVATPLRLLALGRVGGLAPSGALPGPARDEESGPRRHEHNRRIAHALNMPVRVAAQAPGAGSALRIRSTAHRQALPPQNRCRTRCEPPTRATDRASLPHPGRRR